METLKPILQAHPFFKDLKPEFLDFITGCATNVRFKENEVIVRENESADKFFLLREGNASITIELPGKNSIAMQTIHAGDILGWSWLIPPHRYRFTCYALTDVRAIALDGKCLRKKCEDNHDLGYELLKRLASIFTQRLEVTRKQLIDMYDINVEKNKS